MNIHETPRGAGGGGCVWVCGELFESVYRQFKWRDMCVCILPKTKKKKIHWKNGQIDLGYPPKNGRPNRT